MITVKQGKACQKTIVSQEVLQDPGERVRVQEKSPLLRLCFPGPSHEAFSFGSIMPILCAHQKIWKSEII
jgi:hypothetical protein